MKISAEFTFSVIPVHAGMAEFFGFAAYFPMDLEENRPFFLGGEMEFEKMKTRRVRKIRRGFTLIELAFGLSLFTFALFGIIALLGESLAFGKFSNSRVIAMNETRRVLEEIRRVADTGGLSTVAGTPWTDWASQNLNNTLVNQNVAVTDTLGNALINNADPLPVRVTMTWTEKGKNNTYSVDTLVTKR